MSAPTSHPNAPLKASSNAFVADERVFEGPAGLTIYNGLQIALYTHRSQAGRTSRRGPGVVTPAPTPSPRISARALTRHRASYTDAQHVVVGLLDPEC